MLIVPSARACASRSPWRTHSFLATRTTLRVRPFTSTCMRSSLTTSTSGSDSPPVAPRSPSLPPTVPYDPNPPNTALLLFCLSTGLVDSLTFAATGVWCAFVTGTTVQLGMDLPSLLYHLPDSPSALYAALTHFFASESSQRFAALSGFLLGGLAGSRFPQSVTPAWSTALQSALLSGASALMLGVGEGGVASLPYPHVTLALISTSMALQAVLVQRFATPYATSVAWTSVWLGAVAPGPANRRWKKIVGLATVMCGAALGAAIIKLGREDEASEEGKDQIVERVGWGLAAAAAIKAVVAGIFWRRARLCRVQL